MFITNGNASSTAGIKLFSMNSIQVSAASSRSGIIQLNARNGKLKLPAGSLNTDGVGNSGAGFIALLADAIQAPNGAVITASQSTTATPTAHPVLISARRIEFGGNGLEIHSNGSALPGFAATAILPKDGVLLTKGVGSPLPSFFIGIASWYAPT